MPSLSRRSFVAPVLVALSARVGGAQLGGAADRVSLRPLPTAERCSAGSPVDARAALVRATTAIGVVAAGDRVLHMLAMQEDAAREQSDRWYPPFLSRMTNRELWLAPTTGVERHTTTTAWPGTIAPVPVSVLASESATYAVRDTLMRAAGPGHVRSRSDRLLDPWAVLRDWRADSTVRYAGSCVYRDYPRTVLARRTVEGPERLYLDPKSGYPVKVEYDIASYLWGQLHTEYVWSTWIAVRGGGAYPGVAFRLEDGETVATRTVAGPSIALMPADSAPRMALPATAPEMRRAPSDPTTPAPPDTVRVGPRTYLLVTPAYTQTVTLLRDTVYLLDATSGEARARQDSAWIARLYPGKHPVVVVVTDLAWPHVAGVRFWAARGATFVTHAASREFLQQLTARRWTMAPDALERSSMPRGARLPIRTLTDSLTLAAGGLRLYPIDGLSSEGALVAYLPGDGYLWASDFVQSLRERTQYAEEVRAAMARVGVTPVWFAAEHVPLSTWAELLRVNAAPDRGP